MFQSSQQKSLFSRTVYKIIGTDISVSYFLPVKFQYVFNENIAQWSVLRLCPGTFPHFSIVDNLRERSRGCLSKDYEAFILMVFLETRLDNKWIWIDIAISIIFFSQNPLHHSYFVERAFELLLFVFVERNVLYYHIVWTSLHPTYQKLHAKVVRVCHRALDFEFISFLDKEILCWFIYFEGVVDHSWPSVVIESL